MKRILPPHARMRQIQENARKTRETKPTPEETQQREEVAPVLVPVDPLPEPAPSLPPLSIEDMVTPPSVEPVEPVEPSTEQPTDLTDPEPVLDASDVIQAPIEPLEEVSQPSEPSLVLETEDAQKEELDLFDPVGLSLTEIKANKRDALNAVATSLGIDISEMKNKTEVAEAIFNLVNGK